MRKTNFAPVVGIDQRPLAKPAAKETRYFGNQYSDMGVLGSFCLWRVAQARRHRVPTSMIDAAVLKKLTERKAA